MASKILKLDLPEKVSGFDLVKNSFDIRLDKKIKYFLFGSKQGIAEFAAAKILFLSTKYIDVVGYRNGYFSIEDIEDIINQINSSGADILLVALGAPRQEKWIHEHKDRLKVKICMVWWKS